MTRITTLLLLIVLMLPAGALAGQLPPPKAKCPVCGMFVAKYKDWLAAITFRDGTTAFFDGPKDMFTYYLNLKKYNPAKGQADVVGIQVNDYYDLKSLDGRKAYYVVGSDVFGPMGKEAVPFGKEADAREFLKDHKGKRIIRFSDMTQAILKTLE